jgi:hypothetical protein
MTTKESKPEECYSINDAKEFISPYAPLNLLQFREYTTYYQTFGGGPEGGYFVKRIPDDITLLGDFVGCWSVKRTWGTPFVATKMYDVVDVKIKRVDGNYQISLVKLRKTKASLAQQWEHAQTRQAEN